MPILCRSIPVQTQVDVLLAEQLRHGQVGAIEEWAHRHKTSRLIRALAQRWRLWDSNLLPAWVQRSYLETATTYVLHDFRAGRVKPYLLLMLYSA
jgi:hypothetical protein